MNTVFVERPQPHEHGHEVHRPRITRTRLPLPDNLNGAHPEHILEQLNAHGHGHNHQGGGGRTHAQVRGFPYHDPAFGCHFRNVTPNDTWDYRLSQTTPDVAPPLHNVFLCAKERLREHEQQKAVRRKLEHLEHEALQKVHMQYLQEGYDEVAGPMPFRKHQQTHEAYVSVDPTHDSDGFVGWLASP
jgi:hypothetical protein